MATCTKPLARPEEPTTANLPCGQEARFAFVLHDTHVLVGRCIDCLVDDFVHQRLVTSEYDTLRRLPKKQTREDAA